MLCPEPPPSLVALIRTGADPLQIDWFDKSPGNKGSIAIDLESLAEQPAASVTVTLYVVVTKGVTVKV